MSDGRALAEWFDASWRDSTDAFLIADAQGHLVRANPLAIQLFSADPMKWHGPSSLPELCADTPGGRGQVREALAKALSGEQVIIDRVQFLRSDRGTFWGRLAVHPAPLAHQDGDTRSAVVEISRLKRQQRPSTEIDFVFRTLADHAPVLMWKADTDGKCNFFNAGWFVFTGRTLEQEIGNGWTEGVHPDDAEGCLAEFKSAFEDRRALKMEYRLRRADGEFRWLLHQGVPYYAIDGTFAGYIGSCVDIQEQRDATERTAVLLASETAARAEAERANRIKDEFLAVLSHELRTPLTGMIGWVQLLRRGNMSPEMQVRALETIERNARTQARLVEDLLDVSAIVSSKLRVDLEPVPLRPAVQAVIAALEPSAAAKGIAFSSQLDPSVGAVAGDARRLEQIVANLIRNAITFTSEGGSVSVELSRVGEHAKIVVKDSGEGISADFLPHVFDRFRQADASDTRSHGGLGLGLTIAHKLVTLHNGEISAESEGRGKGATFRVTFPLLPARDSSPT